MPFNDGGFSARPTGGGGGGLTEQQVNTLIGGQLAGLVSNLALDNTNLQFNVAGEDDVQTVDLTSLAFDDEITTSTISALLNGRATLTDSALSLNVQNALRAALGAHIYGRTQIAFTGNQGNNYRINDGENTTFDLGATDWEAVLVTLRVTDRIGTSGNVVGTRVHTPVYLERGAIGFVFADWIDHTSSTEQAQGTFRYDAVNDQLTVSLAGVPANAGHDPYIEIIRIDGIGEVAENTLESGVGYEYRYTANDDPDYVFPAAELPVSGGNFGVAQTRSGVTWSVNPPSLTAEAPVLWRVQRPVSGTPEGGEDIGNVDWSDPAVVGRFGVDGEDGTGSGGSSGPATWELLDEVNYNTTSRTEWVAAGTDSSGNAASIDIRNYPDQFFVRIEEGAFHLIDKAAVMAATSNFPTTDNVPRIVAVRADAPEIDMYAFGWDAGSNRMRIANLTTVVGPADPMPLRTYRLLGLQPTATAAVELLDEVNYTLAGGIWTSIGTDSDGNEVSIDIRDYPDQFYVRLEENHYTLIDKADVMAYTSTIVTTDGPVKVFLVRPDSSVASVYYFSWDDTNNRLRITTSSPSSFANPMPLRTYRPLAGTRAPDGAFVRSVILNNDNALVVTDSEGLIFTTPLPVAEGAVRYDEDQDLTLDQQQQARENIQAAINVAEASLSTPVGPVAVGPERSAGYGAVAVDAFTGTFNIPVNVAAGGAYASYVDVWVTDLLPDGFNVTDLVAYYVLGSSSYYVGNFGTDGHLVFSSSHYDPAQNALRIQVRNGASAPTGSFRLRAQAYRSDVVSEPKFLLQPGIYDLFINRYYWFLNGAHFWLRDFDRLEAEFNTGGRISTWIVSGNPSTVTTYSGSGGLGINEREGDWQIGGWSGDAPQFSRAPGAGGQYFYSGWPSAYSVVRPIRQSGQPQGVIGGVVCCRDSNGRRLNWLKGYPKAGVVL